MAQQPSDVTYLLRQWRDGDRGAADRLAPLVYDELHRLAHQRLWRERPGHPFDTTDLVHEAFLNLAGRAQPPWQDRVHFFAVAARVMRHILIDYARRRSRVKRGGGAYDVSLDPSMVFSDDRADELLALDQALLRLEAFDERSCRIVECRYFAGLTIEETAEVLALSQATVKRDWMMARSWLRRELSGPS